MEGRVTGDPYAPWHEHRFVVFDVETTGLEDGDRIVELGLARFEQGRLVRRWGSLIYPDMEIPEEATRIHGISGADVATAPRFVGAVADIINIARDAHPVAYNASFDRRFWIRALAQTALSDLSNIPLFDERTRWLDPLVWMRRLHGIWGKNTLGVSCERYSIDVGTAHRATDDAVATGHLMLAIKNDIYTVTLTELLRRQGILDERQDRERGEWFRKKGLPYERR